MLSKLWHLEVSQLPNITCNVVLAVFFYFEKFGLHGTSSMYILALEHLCI